MGMQTDHPFDSDTFTSFVDMCFYVYVQQSTRKPLTGGAAPTGGGGRQIKSPRLTEKVSGLLTDDIQSPTTYLGGRAG